MWASMFLSSVFLSSGMLSVWRPCPYFPILFPWVARFTLSFSHLLFSSLSSLYCHYACLEWNQSSREYLWRLKNLRQVGGPLAFTSIVRAEIDPEGNELAPRLLGWLTRQDCGVGWGLHPQGNLHLAILSSGLSFIPYWGFVDTYR